MTNLIPWAIMLVFFLTLEPLLTYLVDVKKLRRFPNQNRLSGITNLGYMLERCCGFRSKALHELHKDNPIVRTGPNSLSFSSPDAIRAIYGHSTSCLKGDMYAAPAGPHSNILDVIDKQDHARKRRYMSHALATRNLETWEFKVADKIQRLLRQFDRVCEEAMETTGSGTVDFRKWTNLFTVEAIADIALSRHLGCLENGNDLVTIKAPDGREKTVSYIGGLHAGKRATSTFVWATRWFRLLRKFFSLIPGYFRSQWSQGDQFDDMVRCLTYERLQRHENGEDLDDIVRSVIQDKAGQPRDLDRGEIEAEVSVLCSDTTAIALTHVMFNLLRTPKAMDQLREELNGALQDDDDVASYDQVKSLPYLRACLDESLRLLPPVSFGLHRKTSPDGMTIDAQWIPGDTTVSVPAYTAHRNPVLFPNPESYCPERWLEEMDKDARVSFIPFSAGARGCIGRNITYIEQTMLIASLIHRYDFTLPSVDWELDHEEAFNLWPGPMPLKIRRRINSKEIHI